MTKRPNTSADIPAATQAGKPAKASAKVTDRRLAILGAALDCFLRHGVETTTIDMIREASSASTGSIYHHFGSKEGVAVELYLEGLRSFRAFQMAAFEGVTSLESGVRAVVYANVDWIGEQPDWARFLFNHRGVLAHAPDASGVRSELGTSQSAFAEWMAASLPPHQRLRWPLEAYLALVVGPVHEYARHWLAGQRTVPLESLREFFADAACRAVGLDGAA